MFRFHPMNHLLPKSLLLATLLAAGSLAAAETPANWEKHCSTCHGADGKGVTMMGKKLKIKDLTDPEFQKSFTDADAVKAVREGIKSEDGKTRMKPIAGLSDAEVQALVAYVRTLVKS